MRPARFSWHILMAVVLLAGGGLFGLYRWLPADGATGDLESFTPSGFRVQWLLESRPEGLQVGDVIVRAGGRTVEEWLRFSPQGPGWRSGDTISYEILRQGRPLTLSIRLAPVPLAGVARRWWPQFAGSFFLLFIGSFAYLKRPRATGTLPALLFCLLSALHLWVDAYNLQFSLLPWSLPLYYHLVLEQGCFILGYAAVCHFALTFPERNPLLRRFPRSLLVLLYLWGPLALLLPIPFARTRGQYMVLSNHVAVVVAAVLMLLAAGAALYSVRTVRDPVSRAQIRWLLWGASLAVVAGIPGYIVPMALGYAPLISHPAMTLLTLVIPVVYAIAILRFRLFDIEILINRTLVYGTLTILLASLYLVLVRVGGKSIELVLNRQDDGLVVFGATLVVALAFAPLRQRVQRLIDRILYRTRPAYQELLAGFGERLAASIAPDRLVALLTRELPERLGVTSAALLVLDQMEEGLTLVGGSEGGYLLPINHPLAEALRRRRQPIMRLDPPPLFSPTALALLEQRQVSLSIPLLLGRRLVGIYNLGPRQTGDVWSQEEIHLLSLLGQQVAIAVENSRLLQAAELQAGELAVLRRAAIAMSSTLQMKDVLTVVATQLNQAVSTSNISLYDWDPVTFQSTLLAEWNYLNMSGGPGCREERLDMRRIPALLQVVQDKQTFVLQASAADLDSVSRRASQRSGWKSCLLLPLVSREEAIGYAVLWETRFERRFTEAEMRLCQTLAADATVAIERAHLFESEREQRQLAEALQEAAAGVSGSLDLDVVLDHILEQVERVVAGDAFNVMLIEEEHARIVRWRGYDRLGAADQVGHLSMPLSAYSTLATMLETGEPLVVTDVAADARWHPVGGWEWLRSYIGVPIRVAGRTVGFLNVDGARVGLFGPADARRLKTFADHAATAIETARLFEEARRRTAYLEAHSAMIAAAALSTDQPELLRVTLHYTLQALGLDMGYLWVEHQQVSRHLPTEIGPILALLPQVIGQGASIPIVVEDWRQTEIEDLTAIAPGMVENGVCASLMIPLVSEGKHIGSLNLASPVPRAWSTDDVAMVESVGRQLVAAVERVRLLNKTREQARQVQLIISTVPEGVLLLGADRQILLANPPAREYLSVLVVGEAGLPLLSLGGRPIEELLAPPQSGLWHELLSESLPRRTFELIARPLEGEVELEGWVLLIRDVTAEREIQENIQQQNRLASLGQLAGGIAHDFNNILTIITLGAETCLGETGLSEAMVSGLQRILTEAHKAAHLVRQILDFSRHSWIQTRTLDLQPIIQEVAAILSRTLPENIRLSLQVEPGQYTVKADPARIQQVLMNLALNSRDAMPGGGELQIGLKPVDLALGEEPPVAEMPAGQWLCLSIVDTGTGMTPEVRAHLFEPFFTTKPVGHGTGLGLAQVYGILKQHDGYVAVETEVGQGTTFNLYLPLLESEACPEVARVESSPSAPRGLGETVLLAEDDEGVRLYCRDLLHTLGYRVLEAENGRDALDLFQKIGPIDLLLTDMVMPEMSGKELIAALRQLNPALRVIVMTGYPLGTSLDLPTDGVLEVLQKPVNVATLSQTVRRVLDV